MNIWQFQAELSRRLLRWGAVSVLVGIGLRPYGTFLRKVGEQFAGWGIVNIMIAVFGQLSMRQRIDQMENPGKRHIKQKEAHNLSRLLWINAGLDVLYMLGGWLWSRRDTGNRAANRGNGLGVMIQGAFLFVFDIYHGLKTPDKN